MWHRVGKIRLLWLVSLLFVVAQPAAARLELSAEEREIVQWFMRDTATDIDDAVGNVSYIADQALTRTLLLTACPVKLGSQRFLSPTYVRLVLDAAGLYERAVDEEVRSNGYLPDAWQAAAVFAWRRWTPGQRQSWLAYMRSPDGQWGYASARMSNVLESFNTHTVDLMSGDLMPSLTWPGWLNAVLVKSGLDTSFRRAANQVEPGLGDRFLAEAPKAFGDQASEAERKLLAELTRSVAGRWEAIWKALLADWMDATPAMKGQLDRWLADPLAREIEGFLDRTMTRDSDPKFAAFLAAAGHGDDHRSRRMEALMAALRPQAQSMCSALR